MVNKIVKKYISFILCLAFFVSVVPLQVLALENNSPIVRNVYAGNSLYTITTDNATTREVISPNGDIATFDKINNTVTITGNGQHVFVDLNQTSNKFIDNNLPSLQSVVWENSPYYNWKYKYTKYSNMNWTLRISDGTTLGTSSTNVYENTYTRTQLYGFKNAIDGAKANEQAIAAAGFGGLLAVIPGTQLMAALIAAGASAVILTQADQLDGNINTAKVIFYELS